jgi:hypothetical protein
LSGGALLPLLVALDDPPGLAVLGLAAPDPGPAVVPVAAAGRPLFPTVHRSGRVAYLAITPADPPWQTCVALVAADGELRDLLPDAAIFAPPAWSPCGTHAVTIRGDPADSRLIRTDFDTGEEQILYAQPGLRSVAVGADGTLLFSTAAGLYRLGRDGGVETLFDCEVGAGFIHYGNDDLFVTLDQLAVSADRTVAVVVRWHTAGNSAREMVAVLRDGRLEEVASGRYPQWTASGELILTRPSGDVALYSGAALRFVCTLASGAHSATAWHKQARASARSAGGYQTGLR